jgi:hypothetical protein
MGSLGIARRHPHLDQDLWRPGRCFKVPAMKRMAIPAKGGISCDDPKPKWLGRGCQGRERRGDLGRQESLQRLEVHGEHAKPYEVKGGLPFPVY